MARKEGIHKGLEIGTPPLGKGVTDFPVRIGIRASILRGETVIQAGFETADFIGGGRKVIARSVSRNGQLGANRTDSTLEVSQLEKRICDL